MNKEQSNYKKVINDVKAMFDAKRAEHPDIKQDLTPELLTHDEWDELQDQCKEMVSHNFRFAVLAKLREKLAEQPAQPKECQCPACKIAPHASDCSVHNEPAWPNGPCDCVAQPEQPAQQQEPVAYSYTSRITGAQGFSHHPMPRFIDAESWDIKPLYTSPPASKPWVGLTDYERNALWRDVIGWGDPSHDDDGLMKALEAKLKEKNA